MHCQLKRKSHAPRIAVGDIVIIHDDLPRAMWKLGIRRAAILRVSSRGRTSTHLQRPVQKLYPIEMAVKTTEDQRNPETESEQDHDTSHLETHEPDYNPPPPQWSRRAAAMTARDRIMAQTLESGDDDF